MESVGTIPPGVKGMPCPLPPRRAGTRSLIRLATSIPPGIASKIRRPASKAAPPVAAPTAMGAAVRTARDLVLRAAGARVPKTVGAVCALRVLPANLPMPGILLSLCRAMVRSFRPRELRRAALPMVRMPPPGAISPIRLRVMRSSLARPTMSAAVRPPRLPLERMSPVAARLLALARLLRLLRFLAI